MRVCDGFYTTTSVGARGTTRGQSARLRKHLSPRFSSPLFSAAPLTRAPTMYTLRHRRRWALYRKAPICVQRRAGPMGLCVHRQRRGGGRRREADRSGVGAVLRPGVEVATRHGLEGFPAFDGDGSLVVRGGPAADAVLGASNYALGSVPQHDVERLLAGVVDRGALVSGRGPVEETSQQSLSVSVALAAPSAGAKVAVAPSSASPSTSAALSSLTSVPPTQRGYAVVLALT